MDGTVFAGVVIAANVGRGLWNIGQLIGKVAGIIIVLRICPICRVVWQLITHVQAGGIFDNMGPSKSDFVVFIETFLHKIKIVIFTTILPAFWTASITRLVLLDKTL